jgi:hypothetical protein
LLLIRSVYLREIKAASESASEATLFLWTE